MPPAWTAAPSSGRSSTDIGIDASRTAADSGDSSDTGWVAPVVIIVILTLALILGVGWHRRELRRRAAGAVKPSLMAMKPNPTYLIATETADPDGDRVPARPGYQPLEAENGVYGDFVQTAAARGAASKDYSITSPDPLAAVTVAVDSSTVTAPYTHALSPEKHGYENVTPDDTSPVHPRGYMNGDLEAPTTTTTAVA